MTDPDDDDVRSQQSAKRYRVEGQNTVEEDLHENITNDSSNVRNAVPPVSSRWSSATPRQYGGGKSETTPRMALGGLSEFEGGWRGFATPSATPVGGGEVITPHFRSNPPPSSMHTPRGGGAMGRMPQGGNPRTAYDPTPRYDHTPHGYGNAVSATGGATPAMGNGMFVGSTPSHFEGTTPKQSRYVAGGSVFGVEDGGDAMIDEHAASTMLIEKKAKQLEVEWRKKNQPLSPEFLDEFLPSREYFEVVPPPADYNPIPEEPNFYELAAQEFSAAGEFQTFLTRSVLDIPESLGPGMPALQPKDEEVFVELLQYAGNEDSIPPAALLSYMLMKNLFKIKNGDAVQRRVGTRYLLEKAHVFGPKLLFERWFLLWRADYLDVQQKHLMMEFCKALLSKLGSAVRQSCKEVVYMLEPLLSEKEPVIREDGRQTLTLLARVVGFRTMWSTIRPDFGHQDNSLRRHTAKVVGIIAAATGLEEVVDELKRLSAVSASFARQTVARSIGEICGSIGHAVVSTLGEIVPILERLLRDERRVSREAALTVALMAEVCAPYGRDELSAVVHQICSECRNGIGTSAAPFLRAFGSLLPLMSQEEARLRIKEMMPLLVNQFHTPEEEYRCTLLTVVRRCVSIEGTSAEFIAHVVLEPFFDGFWKVQRLAAERKTPALLLSTTVAIARKVGSEKILDKLADGMTDDNEAFQRLVLNGVRRVIAAVGLEEADSKLCHMILETTISAIKLDKAGNNKVAYDTLATICNALGNRLAGPLLFAVHKLVLALCDSSEPKVRTHAADLITRIARSVMSHRGVENLREMSSKLYTRIQPDYLADGSASSCAPFSANLRATRVLLEVLGRDDNGAPLYLPSVKELLETLLRVLKRQVDTAVQQNGVSLIEVIVNHFSADVNTVHLHQLANRGLFDLLDANRRETRRICARTFGAIAQKISPFSITRGLVDNFRQDKRKIRICTAVALGAIAKSCGPFTVLPYILNEFETSEREQVAVIVQHAALKAIRYIFEAIGAAGEDYVFCTIPLLQRAMTETSVPMRRMAIEASRAMLMAVAGLDGFEAVTIHLLNFAHPNIIELLSKKETKVGEERLKLVSAVVSFYEAVRLHVGSGTLYQYLVQGLFHPAKLVRDVYRRAYNLLYLASPEQLVPHYALVPNGTEHPVPAPAESGVTEKMSSEEQEEERRLRNQPLKRFYRYEITVPF